MGGAKASGVVRPDPVDVSVGTPRVNGWIGIDHVQVAIPAGGEDVAREFYVGALGLTEVPKPPTLAARGGAWFEAGEVRIHVGVDDPFAPARKAHPAIVRSQLRSFVEHSGLEVRWDDEIQGVVRCFVADPFGNRIELIDAESASAAGSEASVTTSDGADR